jgi:hypothetical protein
MANIIKGRYVVTKFLSGKAKILLRSNAVKRKFYHVVTKFYHYVTLKMNFGKGSESQRKEDVFEPDQCSEKGQGEHCMYSAVFSRGESRASVDFLSTLSGAK